MVRTRYEKRRVDMNSRQVVLGSILYTVLASIDKREDHGKRGRKAIMKKIKKSLMVYGNSDSENYLKLVGESGGVLESAKEELNKNSFLLNPGVLIRTIKGKYPEYLDVYDISDDHIQNIAEAYESSNAGYTSVQLANRIVLQVDKFVESLEEK